MNAIKALLALDLQTDTDGDASILLHRSNGEPEGQIAFATDQALGTGTFIKPLPGLTVHVPMQPND